MASTLGSVTFCTLDIGYDIIDLLYTAFLELPLRRCYCAGLLDACPKLVHDVCPKLVHDVCPKPVHDVCPKLVHDVCPKLVHDVCPKLVHDVCPKSVKTRCSSYAKMVSLGFWQILLCDVCHSIDVKIRQSQHQTDIFLPQNHTYT